MNKVSSISLSVCLSGCTQGTLYTTTPVFGLLVHQEGAICTMVHKGDMTNQYRLSVKFHRYANHETFYIGRWAHVNAKLLHLTVVCNCYLYVYGSYWVTSSHNWLHRVCYINYDWQMSPHLDSGAKIAPLILCVHIYLSICSIQWFIEKCLFRSWKSINACDVSNTCVPL